MCDFHKCTPPPLLQLKYTPIPFTFINTLKIYYNSSKILIQNGAKNNNASFHMLLHHFYAFGLLLNPSNLMKKSLREGTHH